MLKPKKIALQMVEVFSKCSSEGGLTICNSQPNLLLKIKGPESYYGCSIACAVYQNGLHMIFDRRPLLVLNLTASVNLKMPVILEMPY